MAEIHLFSNYDLKRYVTGDGRQKEIKALKTEGLGVELRGVIMAEEKKPNAKYWVGILYLENMIEDWKDSIGDTVELPVAYCVHDQDLDNDGDCRKPHVHMILAFPNTTTYKNALSVYDLLSAPGKKAINTCKKVISIRGSYNYLIHDTDDCRKKGKHLYDKSERITLNNFDIGAYEQLDISQKNEMIRELAKDIIDHNFINFTDFYCYVLSNYEDLNYFDLVKSYSGLFERLTKGNYQKLKFSREFPDMV